MTSDDLQVVVIDDVRRFPLYVWRYLSRCVGFGTGGVSNDRTEQRCPFWQDGPKSLATPAHDAQVWWIESPGKGEKGEITWKDQLNAVLRELRTASRRCFLVDVRWAGGENELHEVLQFLASQGIRVRNDSETEVLLVSSYYTAPRAFRGQPLPIYPKSPETLELLFRRLPLPREIPAGPPSVHILVTGAGFEFKDPDRAFLQLGTRFTATILKQVLPSCGLSCEEEEGEQFAYPLPSEYRKKPQASALRRAAKSGDLDTYWDELLRLELDAAIRKRLGKTRRADKVAASRKEYSLRDAFREQYLADDWGFLNQALRALDFPAPGLTAWLTTNYTRFADRAIELAAHRRQAGQGSQPDHWRIVSTFSEAERLLQEMLHPTQGKPAAGSDGRLLFKLHGDLAHLLTMAIAGHDKEIYSPLSLPIDSLHPVYTAAEQYLKTHLRNPSANVFWHVVGHGLRDVLLVQLIRSVCQSTNPGRHGFLVVNLYPDGPCKLLQEGLQGLRIRKRAFLALRLRADQYLSRVRLRGLPCTVAELQDFPQTLHPADPGWGKDLPFGAVPSTSETD